MNADKLKVYVARTLSTEDEVLMDLTNEFSVDEIAESYYKLMERAKLMPDKNASVIASSVLAIGMSTVIRVLAERRLREDKK